MRFSSFAGIALGCCGITLAFVSPVVTGANPRRMVTMPAHVLPVRPFASQPRARLVRVREALMPSPMPCETTMPDTFVAITDGTQDFATGTDSSQLGGTDNEVCGNYASIVAGELNRIGAAGSSGDTDFSIIGAGQFNDVVGPEAFVGAGAQNYVAADSGFIGAGEANLVTGSGSAIAGGGYLFYNSTPRNYGNSISATDAFIGAGDQNTIAANQAFIGGGLSNAVGSSGTYASIVGGARNSATATYATVIGGYGNTASGAYAIVAGGNSDTAAGTLSFAAGYHANAAHNGSFVWSDYSSGSTTVKDTAVNQFVVRASGGTTIYSNEAATAGVKLAAGGGSWASLSDRSVKTGVVPLDDASILAKIDRLPVSAWSYKTETGVRHLGPMAQDFYAAFGVGEDDRHITSIDEDGVALSAIKALDRKNASLQATVDGLRAGARRKDADFAALSLQVRRLEAAMVALQKR